jgi:hypothetical protein
MTKPNAKDEYAPLATGSSQLASLEDAELHRLWRVRIGRNVPSHLPRGLFQRLLSYRLQAQEFGDLDRSVRARLDRALARDVGSQDVLGHTGLKPGSVLVREHGGELHRVMVLDQGFAWAGNAYRSLSETAFAITGTKWNGRRFFGLDQKETHAGRNGVKK